MELLKCILRIHVFFIPSLRIDTKQELHGCKLFSLFFKTDKGFLISFLLDSNRWKTGRTSTWRLTTVLTRGRPTCWTPWRRLGWGRPSSSTRTTWWRGTRQQYSSTFQTIIHTKGWENLFSLIFKKYNAPSVQIRWNFCKIFITNWNIDSFGFSFF